MRGPGLWKFNNALLNDETYVNLIRDSYSGIKEKHTEVTEPKLKWELIKMEIRSLTIPSVPKTKQGKLENLKIHLKSV